MAIKKTLTAQPADVKAMMALLKSADRAYFNSDTPAMKDKQYDLLREQLEKLGAKLKDPKIKAKVKEYLESTGVEESSGAKVDLPFYLPSLDKLKSDSPAGITKFLARIAKVAPTALVIGPKFDGSSFLLRYSRKTGKLVSAFTRGSGHVGRDIMGHAATLVAANRIPAALALDDMLGVKGKGRHLHVRCEICMRKDDFKKWQGKSVGGKKLEEVRNAVNGWVISKRPNAKFAADLSVVAFDLTDDNGDAVFNLKTTAVNWLARQKFSSMFADHIQTVNAKNASDESAFKATLDECLKEVSGKKFEVECDGLVIEANQAQVRKTLRKERGPDKRPYYAMAYKYGVSEDTTAQITTVKKIVFTFAADGALVPNVEYEPITVGNTVLRNALLHNVANMRRLKIGKGCKIKVVRSGGVIPHVVEVVQKGLTRTKVPTKCPTCGAKTEVGEANVYCTNSLCDGVLAARFSKAISYMDLDGLGGKGVTKLREGGIDTVPKLFKTKLRAMQTILGQSNGARAHTAVATVRDADNSWAYWMTLSGVFISHGHSLADKKLELIVQALGMDGMTKIDHLGGKDRRKTLKERLSKAKGLGAESIDLFVLKLPQFLAFMKRL